MKILLVGLLMTVSVLLSGCAIKKLWESDPSGHRYQEQISSALISHDGKILVIVGKEYHYIFDAPPMIVRTLSSGYQKFVAASFGTFSVDESQKITGNFTLQIKDDAPDDAKNDAIQAGFGRDSSGSVRGEVALSGTRYSAGGVKIGTGARALNREYTIDVDAPANGNADLAKKVLLTPVAVLADGTLVIAGVVAGAAAVAYYGSLAIIMLPFVAAKEIACGASKTC